ncbi:ATP-binding protein [Azohydromonas aeria]|uniref:ATP-binding protein n=1 Tax=Azohydromonas aeria TaxID=2590212 RepID=UPI0012F9789D|nr:ATP-binding protein [Azohydromonas aeria]
MSIRIGEVIGVQGIRITLRIDEDSNHEVLFYEGQKYKGVSIREYISIQRGFRDIICIIEGEYLDESRVESSNGKLGYIRKVEARPIGFFDTDGFQQGIKFMPMIQDPAYLLPESKIASIFDRSKAGDNFQIGKMLKEDIPVSLPWRRLFNSHIGIFGNTGSGKSNTLAKLYTVLFNNKLHSIVGKSRFVIIDFNGEYTGNQLAPNTEKIVYSLSTRPLKDTEQQNNKSVFPLESDEFWDTETLSLLFQATTNTQRPFLNRVIEGRRRYEKSNDSINAYAKKKFRDAFCAGQPKAATLDLMRTIARVANNQELIQALKNVNWHSLYSKFFQGNIYFNTDGSEYDKNILTTVDSLDVSTLDAFDQLIIRVNLQLIGDLINGYVQFDHIQPLLKRIESSLVSLRRVISVGDGVAIEKLVTVISLRRCNNEIKKVLPLLFAKHYYNSHRHTVNTPPDKTMHLIIDEAHNILSQQSNRESESWKDYRLEQFEEIIKEGRKFGVFITVSSQRPADISPTIVSQLHNFFIHRLVNERDLFLMDNSISTLDNISRSLIPGLAQGSCVATGTAFELPMLLQVDRLPHDKQPASEDVNLEILWS